MVCFFLRSHIWYRANNILYYKLYTIYYILYTIYSIYYILHTIYTQQIRMSYVWSPTASISISLTSRFANVSCGSPCPVRKTVYAEGSWCLLRDLGNSTSLETTAKPEMANAQHLRQDEPKRQFLWTNHQNHNWFLANVFGY